MYPTNDRAKEQCKMPIDRHKLISRHSPVLNKVDVRLPFSLGNGEFTFTADITGLQTFLESYMYTPLCSMTQWGWHSYPVNLDESLLRLKEFDTYGRSVGYATDAVGQQDLFDNLRQNPHRLNLGNISLFLNKNDKPLELSDISKPHQVLNMFEGLLASEFTLSGKEVQTQTCVDPVHAAVASKIKSHLLSTGEASVIFSFPYGSHEKSASDWKNENKHHTIIHSISAKRAVIRRILDGDEYYTDITFEQNVCFELTGKHRISIIPAENSEQLSFVCCFSKTITSGYTFDFEQTKRRAADHWGKFWLKGGVLQLANSDDRRAFELERRIVLSQYLTAIQCSGSVPPAETGLTCNSWYGKFHLEMHYWHAAHFPLWGRPELLEKSLEWYLKILPVAKEIAAKQGYTGARWPKMCDESGRNSPSWIAVLLIWQQPHPIMLAELCYRAHPTKEKLVKYREMIIETAEFMTSYAHEESISGRYVLGPPLIPVQETHSPHVSKNPAFELEYFRWGLETAVRWLQRLGEPVPAKYSYMAGKLSALPVNYGVYTAHENCPQTFFSKEFTGDHPSMLGALGVLPGKGVNHDIMKATLENVIECWDFESMWGWDFPMMAMSCARLGQPSLAIEMLLMDSPKNKYALNGHNPQAEREDLPIYLPGNGALLIATGMMASGWDYDNGMPAPGFPKDSGWLVEAEDIFKYI